jgi:hypothetical protein
VTGKIESNHSVALGEVGYLIAPVVEVARPAVYQDQSFLAFAVAFVMECAQPSSLANCESPSAAKAAVDVSKRVMNRMIVFMTTPCR